MYVCSNNKNIVPETTLAIVILHKNFYEHVSAWNDICLFIFWQLVSWTHEIDTSKVFWKWNVPKEILISITGQHSSNTTSRVKQAKFKQRERKLVELLTSAGLWLGIKTSNRYGFDLKETEALMQRHNVWTDFFCVYPENISFNRWRCISKK